MRSANCCRISGRLPESRKVSSAYAYAALLVEAGKLWDGETFVQQPIPYGTKPRLILAYLNAYAVRHRTQEIEAGKSASAFLKMLGIQPNGGTRGSYTEFKQQMTALAACKVTLGLNVGNSPAVAGAECNTVIELKLEHHAA